MRLGAQTGQEREGDEAQTNSEAFHGRSLEAKLTITRDIFAKKGGQSKKRPSFVMFRQKLPYNDLMSIHTAHINGSEWYASLDRKQWIATGVKPRSSDLADIESLLEPLTPDNYTMYGEIQTHSTAEIRAMGHVVFGIVP